MNQQLMQTSQFCQVFGGATMEFGLDGIGSPDVRPFAIVNNEIVNWCCMCGRVFVNQPGSSVKVQPGTSAWLKITHPTSDVGFSIDIVMSGFSPGNTSTTTYLKLYDFDENGAVTRDYRGMPTMPFYN